MLNPFFLKDNSKHQIAHLSEEEFSALNIIANKTIKELLSGNDNLLVYPNNTDRIEEQTVFNLYSDNTLNSTNVVGFIGVNDIKINIGSRFSEDTGKQYFIQYMLQKIHKLNLFDFKTTHDNTNIWEQLLYLIFPIFLKRAYHQGIFKIYQRKHYNDSNLKGRIEIDRHIKQNLPFVGNISYCNKELSYNNPVTQLIRHTIEYISAKGFQSIFYNDYNLINAVQIIKLITPDYNIRDRQKLIFKNHKKVNHPFFTEYEPLRKICIQILNRDGLSFRDNHNKVYGLLIDAAWLWEEYLNSVISDLGFLHPENLLGKGALKLFANNQDIFPDFYNFDRSIVADAKYKKLKDNELNREDIYQVVTYMYRLKAKYGILVYPAKQEDIKTSRMHGESYGSTESLFIKYGMNIPQETSVYHEYTDHFKEPEKVLKHFIAHEIFQNIEQTLEK